MIEELPRGELSARITELSARTFSLPSGKQRSFTARTLWTWWSRYKRAGLKGLVPTPRADKGRPKVVDAKTLEAAIACRKEVPSRSTATVIDVRVFLIPATRLGHRSWL